MSEQQLDGAAGVSASSPAEAEGHKGDDHANQGKDVVTITVNGSHVSIHRGRQSVSEIKRLGGVPAADELAQVIEGQPLKPLADDGSLVIRGGEEFVSYPKDSSSSFVGAMDRGNCHGDE